MDAMLGLMKHHAKKSTDSRRPRPYNEYGIFLCYFRDTSRPKACGEHIAHKQSLLVGHAIGNTVQSLIC